MNVNQYGHGQSEFVTNNQKGVEFSPPTKLEEIVRPRVKFFPKFALFAIFCAIENSSPTTAGTSKKVFPQESGPSVWYLYLPNHKSKPDI